MNYWHTLIFYSFASPLLFVYGIGLERLCIVSNNSLSHLHFYAKNFLFVFATSTVGYVFFNVLAYPLHITFFFPLLLMIMLFFGEKGIDYLYEGFVYRGKPVAHSERVFNFGTVIFALYEASSYIELLLIVLVSFVLLIIFATLVRSIRKKMDAFNIENKLKNLPQLLITLGAISTALYFLDVLYW